MSILADRKYSKEHEWALSEAEGVKVGITDYAQSELGDVVYVDLPAVGKSVKQGESFMTVESVKAVSDIYAPIDGTVVGDNAELANAPELVNKTPYADGWMVVIKPENAAQINSLLTSADYESFISGLTK